MSRAFDELKVYKKTGNCEHLFNCGLYCALEQMAPENKKFHYNPEVQSVTRQKYAHLFKAPEGTIEKS